MTPLGLRPYREEEVFYATNAGRFEVNWLGGSLVWRPARGVRAGYRWSRFRVGDDWRNRDVLVVGLSLFL